MRLTLLDSNSSLLSEKNTLTCKRPLTGCDVVPLVIDRDIVSDVGEQYAQAFVYEPGSNRMVPNLRYHFYI